LAAVPRRVPDSGNLRESTRSQKSMSTDWKIALEYFDRALAMPEVARRAWLLQLETENPQLAQDVLALLDAQATAGSDGLDQRLLEAAAQVADVEPAMGSFEPGQSVGSYRLIRRVGRGGMASVWLAERVDGTLRREFALKLPVSLPPEGGFADRFARERDFLARLRHPNIARLYDAGVDSGGQPFLALDYIQGQAITTWSDARALTIDARLALFGQVLDAVQYAHANLVMHRDLKPANILIDEQGRASLLDFGIAKLLDSSGAETPETELTRAGGRLLTVQYASPEQLRGDPLTIATDIYSLGVVLHELLAGRRPYSLAFQTPAQLERAIAEGIRESLTRSASDPRAQRLGLRTARAMRKALGGDLDAIVAKAMSPDTASRYATVDMFHEDLRRLRDGHAISARRPSRFRAATRFVRRHALASGIVAILVCGLLASAIVAITIAGRERAQRERAEAVRSFLVGVFAQASPDENRGQPFTALQLLEKGEKALPRAGEATNATRADLNAVIGDLYWSIGEFARAEPLLRQAIATSNDPEVPGDVKARALMGLANMEAEKRAFDDALLHLDQAREFALGLGSDGQSIAGDARRQRADVLVRLGDFETAEPLLRELLIFDRRLSGPVSEAVASDWRLLAICLEELSRYDESEVAFAEAIRVARAVHGDQHSSVAYALNDLGLMLMHRGDLSGAERATREALVLSQALWGAESRASWAVESNLLRIVELEGRFGEAMLARKEMLKKEEATLAETTPETLAFHTNYLGLDYRELGQLEEAEATFRDAMARWARIHGKDDSPDGAAARVNLGVTLSLQGRLGEAEHILRDAVALRAAHEPPGSLMLNLSRGELGNVLRLQGRTREALEETRNAVDAYATALGASGEAATPGMIALLAQLAESQLDAGMIGEAEQSARQALDRARELLPAGNPRLGASLFALARARLAQERPSDAEPLLREALGVRKANFPSHDPRILEIQVALVDTLDALGKTGDARRLRSEIEPLLDRSSSAYARTLRSRLPNGNGAGT
jgi:eukaryotic-like serine/threonine-protein kinase